MSEDTRKKLEEIMDKIGVACWLTTYSVVGYPIFDHKRVAPKFEKYIEKLEELIQEYKRTKQKLSQAME